MNNILLVIPYIIKNIKLIKCINFISASYEEIGSQLFIYLDYKLTNFNFYEWLKYTNKTEKCYYNTFIKDNDATIVRSSYLVPKNKFVYIKLMLNNCITSIDFDAYKDNMRLLFG